jgi:hypothetical protein
VDNEVAIHGAPQPVVMGVPPKRSTLAIHCELVDLRASDLQWALGYMSWPVCPVRQKLEYPMPAQQIISIKLHPHTKIFNFN